MKIQRIANYLPYLIWTISVIKWGKFLLEERYFQALGWPLICAWILWLAYAFKTNKKLPSYSGDFSYKNGENQVARIAYLLTMVGIFILVAVVG
jgi:hypothetical protein